MQLRPALRWLPQRRRDLRRRPERIPLGRRKLSDPQAGRRALVTPAFVVVTAVNFFDFLALSAFLLLPRYLKDLGRSDELVGMIMGASGVVSVLAVPSVGIWVDRIGRRPFMLFGSGLLAVGSACFCLPGLGNWGFVLLRALHGLAFACFFVSTSTLVADLAPPARRAEALGYFGVFALTTNAIAPAGGELVVELLGFRALFAGACALAVVGLVLSLLVKDPSRKTQRSEATPVQALLRQPRVWAPVLLSAILATGFGSAVTFVAAMGVDRSLAGVAPFFVVYVAASVGIRLIAGRLPDRIGHRRATIPAAMSLALGLWFLAGATSANGLILAGAFFGLGHGITYPSLSALVIARVSEADRGKAMGLYSGAFSVGITVSAFGYGMVAGGLGYGAMYKLAAILVVVGTLAFALGDKPDKLLT